MARSFNLQDLQACSVLQHPSHCLPTSSDGRNPSRGVTALMKELKGAEMFGFHPRSPHVGEKPAQARTEGSGEPPGAEIGKKRGRGHVKLRALGKVKHAGNT